VGALVAWPETSERKRSHGETAAPVRAHFDQCQKVWKIRQAQKRSGGANSFCLFKKTWPSFVFKSKTLQNVWLLPPMIVQPHPEDRLNIIGTPGMGKSHWRNHYLKPVYRLTVWNPMGDFNKGLLMSVEEYRKNIPEMRAGALRVTVEPQEYDTEAMSDEFDATCAYVEEVGAQHFAIEEIALVSSPNHVPPHFNRLCIRGRHRYVSLSIYGQRFHQFPVIARGTASEIVAFRQVDPDDVKDFEERIAPEESPISLNELNRYEYVHWTPDGGAVLHSPLPVTTQTVVEE